MARLSLPTNAHSPDSLALILRIPPCNSVFSVILTSQSVQSSHHNYIPTYTCVSVRHNTPCCPLLTLHIKYPACMCLPSHIPECRRPSPLVELLVRNFDGKACPCAARQKRKIVGMQHGNTIPVAQVCIYTYSPVIVPAKPRLSFQRNIDMALHHLTPKAYDHLSPKKTSEKKHPFPIDQFPSHNRVEKMEILIRGKTCHSGYKQPCKAYLSSCLKPTTTTITFNPNKTTHLSKVRNKIPTALHRELEPRKCKTRTVAQAACAVLRGKPKRRKYMMTSPMGGGARDAEGCRMRVTDVCRGVVCVCVLMWRGQIVDFSFVIVIVV